MRPRPPRIRRRRRTRERPTPWETPGPPDPPRRRTDAPVGLEVRTLVELGDVHGLPVLVAEPNACDRAPRDTPELYLGPLDDVGIEQDELLGAHRGNRGAVIRPPVGP
jgi:hypothetical protein